MPRIDAPTVAEHRAQIQARLVDVAEELLRAGKTPLTAAAVGEKVGIARNSIYRYVDSIDDLRVMVVARYLPSWLEAVEAAMDVDEPSERIVAWVKANLEQAARSGHGWLMDAMGATASSPQAKEVIDQAHAAVRDAIVGAWRDVLAGEDERSTVAASLTLGILEGGFRMLNAGQPLESVLEISVAGVRGFVDAIAGTGGAANSGDRGK